MRLSICFFPSVISCSRVPRNFASGIFLIINLKPISKVSVSCLFYWFRQATYSCSCKIYRLAFAAEKFGLGGQSYEQLEISSAQALETDDDEFLLRDGAQEDTNRYEPKWSLRYMHLVVSFAVLAATLSVPMQHECI